MPYKREGSPYYYVRRRRLPGYGDTGRLSARTTSKALARRMEQALEDLAEKALLDPSWHALLDAVCKEKAVTLAELLAAKSQGRLESLRRGLHDPKLAAAVEAFCAATEPKHPIPIGLDLLLAYAPAQARLSWLDGKTITALCLRAERGGRKRNSVRRYLLRATSLLLRHHLGKAERDRLFAEVEYAGQDDTREVHLAPEEIAHLLQACEALGYHELAVVVQVALLTSADRSVLLAGPAHHGKVCRGLLRKDLEVFQDNASGRYSGSVFLHDTKAKARTRTVPMTDRLCRELLVLAEGKEAEEPVFSIRYMDLDYVWKKARRAAELEHVRFKDLRAQSAIYGEEAGVPLTVLSRHMGHSRERMTQRYQQRQTSLATNHLEAIEAAMLSSASESERAETPQKTVG